MSEYLPERRYSRLREMLFPVFYKDQFQIIGILILISAAISFIAQNVAMFLCISFIGYCAYALAMQSFLPYSLYIFKDDLDTVVDLLDKTRVIARKGGDWFWKRTSNAPRWLRSELDTITIIDAKNGYVVQGRRDDMEILARALNQRTSIQATRQKTTGFGGQ